MEILKIKKATYPVNVLSISPQKSAGHIYTVTPIKYPHTQNYIMKEKLHLKRYLVFRSILMKEFDHYTERELNVLICIDVMAMKEEHCSRNNMFKYLSELHRTPYKKTFLSTIRKFINAGMIRVAGKGANTKIVLTIEGNLHLLRLEEKLSRII